MTAVTADDYGVCCYCTYGDDDCGCAYANAYCCYIDVGAVYDYDCDDCDCYVYDDCDYVGNAGGGDYVDEYGDVCDGNGDGDDDDGTGDSGDGYIDDEDGDNDDSGDDADYYGYGGCCDGAYDMVRRGRCGF